MELRRFEDSDAEKVLSWIDSEYAFRLWSADTYDKYPVTPADMLGRYATIRENHGGDVHFFVAVEDDAVVGHLIMRVIDSEKGVVRFGYIIVDSSVRGKGYGKRMLCTALEFAKNELSAKEITLGVFDNNPAAKGCYESVGFFKFDETRPVIMGEDWLCHEMKNTPC